MVGISGESISKRLAGVGRGMLGGTSIGFMGITASARDVVFVVDVSGSMISGAKSLETYEKVEREVGSVLKSLTSRSRFGIVVFSKDAEAYKAQLVAVTRDERSKAMRWLRKKSPAVLRDARADEEEKAFHHGTRADLGLARAFSMQPDMIILVSDGEPTGKSASQILTEVDTLQVNRARRVMVNVVAYHADSGLSFMERLAQKNGGIFREVHDRSR